MNNAAANEISRSFTVTMFEDGALTKTRAITGTFSALLARLQAQSPESITTVELYDSGRAINLRKATLTKGNRAITLHV